MRRFGPCRCSGFTWWYLTDAGIPVCTCGHPTGEHVRALEECLGESGVRS